MQQEAAVTVPASQQVVVAAEAAAVPASQQEAVAAEAAAVVPASQQGALSWELKVPTEEAAVRCSPVTTWAVLRVLIQAQVTILRWRKATCW